MNNIKAEAAAGSDAEGIRTADLEQVKNAANANEAFEITLSWGWSYATETRRLVLAKNLLEAVQYVLRMIDFDPESDESNSVMARMIESADVERTYADIRNADDVVDARNWYAKPKEQNPHTTAPPQTRKTLALPLGWEIREVGCPSCKTYEIWFKGNFMDDRPTRQEAEEFVFETEDCRPEGGEAAIGQSVDAGASQSCDYATHNRKEGVSANCPSPGTNRVPYSRGKVLWYCDTHYAHHCHTLVGGTQCPNPGLKYEGPYGTEWFCEKHYGEVEQQDEEMRGQ